MQHESWELRIKDQNVYWTSRACVSEMSGDDPATREVSGAEQASRKVSGDIPASYVSEGSGDQPSE